MHSVHLPTCIVYLRIKVKCSSLHNISISEWKAIKNSYYDNHIRRVYVEIAGIFYCRPIKFASLKCKNPFKNMLHIKLILFFLGLIRVSCNGIGQHHSHHPNGHDRGHFH